MIPHLQRVSHTAGLLTCLYGPGERGNQTNPRLIPGTVHGVAAWPPSSGRTAA